MSHTIRISASDGHEFDAFLGNAAGARKGGVVVGFTLFQFGSPIRNSCRQRTSVATAVSIAMDPPDIVNKPPRTRGSPRCAHLGGSHRSGTAEHPVWRGS